MIDKKLLSSGSSTDSYFFQVYPSYFKVEHAFAKGIKPNTTYRLAVYKGIQKADEMAESIKGKLVGGKIIFDENVLNFYLPVFTPTRNIQFTIKVLETKPGEQQTEITSYKIKSGDYIRNFRADNISFYHEEPQLLDSFILVFEMFVHNSKIELDKIVKEHKQKMKKEDRNNVANNRGKTPKKNQAASENLSQSDRSQTNREGGMFTSKRKLSRKRGHDGKLRSRHNSRDGSDDNSSREGSVRSSQKRFNHFPHNEQGERFVPTPKKASPPKVEERSPTQKVSLTGSKSQNLVTINRKQSSASQVPQIKSIVPGKVIKVQSNIERSESARRNDKRPQPAEIQPIPQKKSSPLKRTNVNNMKATSNDGPVSPKSGADVHQLELKTNVKQIFDIQRKNEGVKASSTILSKTPKQTSQSVAPVEKPVVSAQKPKIQAPQSVSSVERTPSKATASPITRSVTKQVGKVQTQPIVSETPIKIQSILPIEKIINKAQTKKDTVDLPDSNKKEQVPPTSLIPATKPKQTVIASNQIKEETAPVVPKPTSVSREQSVKSKTSKSAVSLIALKNRPVTIKDQHNLPEIRMKQSRRSSSEFEGVHEQAINKQFETIKDKIFYVVFVLLSALLFYNAITPSSKV